MAARPEDCSYGHFAASCVCIPNAFLRYLFESFCTSCKYHALENDLYHVNILFVSEIKFGFLIHAKASRLGVFKPIVKDTVYL